ncbi:alkaline phosphatase family protein [Rhodococcus aerolatus]
MPAPPPSAPSLPDGAAGLADVLPAVLAGLGVPGERAGLGLTDLRRVVVLLVDGMGERLLRRHADAAPFLSSLRGPALAAGFPTTTAASLASLGTGTAAGAHGITGYTSYVAEVGSAVNWLRWRPVSRRDDLRPTLVPEVVQPRATAFERAAADGVAVASAASSSFVGSGLTRAVLRGPADASSISAGDMVSRVAEAVTSGDRSLVYCYLSELDLVGHVRGPGTDAWCEQLRVVDRVAQRLAERLPAGTTLLVTADHGMVAVPGEAKVDLDAHDGTADALRAGVVAVAGEPRARHVHARPGAEADVLATWRELLAGRAWVGTRDDVVGAGLLGPVVTEAAAARTGDVVAVATGSTALVQSRVEPGMSRLAGQHGALADDELWVPLLRHDG